MNGEVAHDSPASDGPGGAAAWSLPWLRGPAGVVVVGLVLAVAGIASEPAALGAARLTALALAVAGASLLVVRAGAADLAAAAGAAAGSYLGGVATALLGWPVLVGIPMGALAGAAVGATSGALHVRAGRGLGALTSLALGGGVVAALGGWPAGGGVGGFHAVPLLSRAGARMELLVAAVVLLLGLGVATAVASSRAGAGAAVAVRSPVVAASLGRRPLRDGTLIGAAAGGLLGAGGTIQAAIDGSVLPAGYGLQLAAAIALASAVGGLPPLGPAIGALVVWGPGTIWPLVPVVGTAPPLLLMGPVGLLVLWLRRGRPLIAWSAPPRRGQHAAAEPAPRPPARQVTLSARETPTPSGPFSLEVRPGEVVALAGPNGAGKSTLLARIAGQLPDGGTVLLDEQLAPRGPVARARGGVRRTWQRPPNVAGRDLARLVAADPSAAAAAAWAAQQLRLAPDDGGGGQQLVQLAASGPAVALLDEPTDVDADLLVGFLRGLADVGAAVLVVDHRPEILAAADRVERLAGAQVVS